MSDSAASMANSQAKPQGSSARAQTPVTRSRPKVCESTPIAPSESQPKPMFETGSASSSRSQPVFSKLDGMASATFYVLSSLAMTTLTKYAASVWRFPSSSLLLLVECAATALGLALIAESGRYRPFSGPILRHLPLLTAAKAVNMYLSFLAMQRTSIPVYNVLKRLNPVFAMAVDWLVRRAKPSFGEQSSVLLICAGTLVTGAFDLEFDLFAYAVAVLAALGQSLYIVLARHASDKVPGLTHVDLLFYTAFYNMIIFTPLAMMEAGEVQEFLAVPGAMRQVMQFLPPYVLLGAMLNYTTFWCTNANSPLATGVAGSFKGVLSTGLGVIFFGAGLAPLGWLGLVMSAAGGTMYSVVQSTSLPKMAAPHAKKA
ncbi:unnamed protein product [Polarella glacialis]|uniref:Sugar phosphate transporter domain-containing protein n=1 Tax=Polarella glacialis TaxID=89957 RepID=A0A813HLI6_POLGL|nr:unnamed protein product [Polarella glacialis]|mmetsp:Transcript_100962/g.182186  ORF Transcript_100962/g.182186 Transcript_100962/m.182186 type:complete len:372 (+) Transcript_100962:81-1196(+)